MVLIIVNSSPICDIVLSTNIEELFSDWNCISDAPGVDICDMHGINCTGNEVTAIDVSNSGVTGLNSYLFMSVIVVYIIVYIRYTTSILWRISVLNTTEFFWIITLW